MIKKKLKTFLAVAVFTSIFSLGFLHSEEAKAYNAGGDGNFRINSWELNNFNSSKDLWVQSRNAYNPEKVQNRVVSGDFDGNGKDEIAAFYDYGSARTQIHRYYEQNGTFVAPSSWDSGIGNFNASSIDNKVVSGDFNGDGKDEILTLYDYGDRTATIFQFSLNSNGTFSDKTVLKTTNFIASSVRAMVAGDFNGDGIDEVLVFLDYGNRYTGLFELKMNSNGVLAEKYVWESTTYDSNRIVGKTVAGDFNGDKKDEVAMFYDYGDGSTKIWTLSNNNNIYSGAEAWYAPQFDSSNITRKVTSTRNKDGSKDKIVAFFDYTYLNNVTGVFTWQMQSNNQFAGTKEKELTNYEASRITGRVTAGKFDGVTNRVTAMHDGVVVQSQNKGAIVVAEAKKHLGKPYVYGATGPDSFDCSGFTQYVYKQAVGIDITRTTYTQVNQGVAVSTSQLQPGDLVFTSADHVQIYIGNGQVIHSPQPGDVVKISPLTTVWQARRVL
jgi:cell wall-associated NlpC family hydrolase